tara:strand:+ start:41 stop:154 length:114 start_codon:yes stop_codon:yes gene_type:complete
MKAEELMHIINVYQNYINDYVNMSDIDISIILKRCEE